MAIALVLIAYIYRRVVEFAIKVGYEVVTGKPLKSKVDDEDKADKALDAIPWVVGGVALVMFGPSVLRVLRRRRP